MILAPFRRSSRWRLTRLFLAIFFALNVLDILSVHRSLSPSQHPLKTPTNIERAKIFIVSTHWNNEAILRSHWNKAILALAEHFGPDNVYVSVYESGSWDNTKNALRELDQSLEELGVNKTIILDQTTHIDEIEKPPTPLGWIDTPRGKKELRRIPYLARLRNESLKPLAELALAGSTFDRVLFLNDVVFTTKDVLDLLNTNNGNYAAACALDFSKPPQYYDTFALRDSEGREPMMQTWPYFRARKSRHAIKSGNPVPVKSCWNGMVFMPASAFYGPTKSLRFRGTPDSLAKYHLEGSECCLIHTDNPMTSEEGVWLNPNVRVGYNGPAYEAVHPGGSWISLSEIIFGIWENRIRRSVTTTWFKEWRVASRVGAWEKTGVDHYEPGRHCLINEMQVLISNGWAHV